MAYNFGKEKTVAEKNNILTVRKYFEDENRAVPTMSFGEAKSQGP